MLYFVNCSSADKSNAENVLYLSANLSAIEIIGFSLIFCALKQFEVPHLKELPRQEKEILAQ